MCEHDTEKNPEGGRAQALVGDAVQGERHRQGKKAPARLREDAPHDHAEQREARDAVAEQDRAEARVHFEPADGGAIRYCVRRRAVRGGGSGARPAPARLT